MKAARRILFAAVLALVCLVAALSLVLLATGSSMLIAERLSAPGIGRVDYVVGRSDLARADWRLQCTYFTGRSLKRTFLEIEPCYLPAPASTCPVVTCPLTLERREREQ